MVVAHCDLDQSMDGTATDLAMTHCTSHITDHPRIAAPWVTSPEIIIGHTNDHPTSCQGMNHTDQIHTPAG